MEEIDETKAFITTGDGTRFQIIGEDGETDLEQTHKAVEEHLKPKKRKYVRRQK